MHLEFEIPVYFVQEFKRKENKTWLCGMNWYRNAHFAVQNNVKAHYHELIKKLISDKVPLEPLLSYQVEYTYHYKNVTSDLGNVCSLASKFVNDALQELGFVIDDNVQYLQREIFSVGKRDLGNPHISVVLKTYKKEII